MPRARRSLRSPLVSGNFALRPFLILVAPSLSLVVIDFRTEVETSVTAWLGVLGYGRTVKWAGVPVYQNFVNLGSQIPLMSHISSSPFASLGGLVPVQTAQQLLLATVLIISASALITSPALKTLSLPQYIPLSAVFLVPTSHYFLANDWSELAIATIGTVPLLMLVIELNLGFRRTTKSILFFIWFGFVCLSVDHFGHFGALTIPLFAVALASIRNKHFRQAIDRHVLGGVAILSLLLLAYWFHDLRFLAQNGVQSNPRPMSLGGHFTNFASAGIGPSVTSIIHGEPLQSVLLLASSRSFFFIWPISFAFLLFGVARKQCWTLHPLSKCWLTSVTGVIVVISGLVLLSGTSTYPFRPSADYQFRDGLLALTTLTYFSARTAFAGSAKPSYTRSTRPLDANGRRTSKQHQATVATVTVIAASLMIFAVPRMKGTAISSGPSCGSLGKGTTIWVDYPAWRGEQPQNPAQPTQCSLFQMIRDDQFSIGGWLKMRQTASDGSTEFELENRIEDLNPAFAERLPIDALVRDGALERRSPRADHSVRPYKRCLDQSCVIEMEPTLGSAQILMWNFDPNLRSDSNLAMDQEVSDGWPAFSDKSAATLIYRAPLSQKVAVSAGWLLHVGGSLWMLITIVHAKSRRFRSDFSPTCNLNTRSHD